MCNHVVLCMHLSMQMLGVLRTAGRLLLLFSRLHPPRVLYATSDQAYGLDELVLAHPEH